MCGQCEGEPYRGVRALFNGDLQAKDAFQDRADWTILSSRVAVYLGQSALEKEVNPLFKGCDRLIESLTIDESSALNALSKSLGRPAVGRP